MDINEIIQLTKAGFSKEDIMYMAGMTQPSQQSQEPQTATAQIEPHQANQDTTTQLLNQINALSQEIATLKSQISTPAQSGQTNQANTHVSLNTPVNAPEVTSSTPSYNSAVKGSEKLLLNPLTYLQNLQREGMIFDLPPQRNVNDVLSEQLCNQLGCPPEQKGDN